MPRPLRIAQVGSIIFPIPPARFGGTERAVSYLTEALVAAGHEVTLFACGDAVTSARLVASRATALNGSQVTNPLPHFAAHFALVRRHLEEFDVVHFHEEGMHFPCFMDIADRTVTTFHMPLGGPDMRILYDAVPEMPLVSISDRQRLPLPQARWAGTVHHGIPADLYRFNPGPGGYLAFIGRFSPTKQPHEAIRIALAAGMPIKLAGTLYDQDRPYWDKRVKPYLDNPLVEVVGELNDAEKDGFLGKARALLFPIDWEEPFGLVMIESMATGTPVVAYRRGAVPEVVEDGITGYAVTSLEAAVDAVGRAADLDRAAVRRRFEERFTDTRMAADYVAIYRRLLAGGGI
ncbi:glycosyltransferase family 4 protein (plasmid) [Skermanella sp. TT6]|uniref:Glycosyltransferase family 4 protein n=1 Tax=Skermanella cutis TaxID=2775420 RepID=A0ABX7BH18_9PROT|nr:glycosyltransferase family 4 protein [Skermanella sp. TT6]QQP93687.1 glycosyltransferase family 4 protein [Skermanella sp. TT6]